MDAGTEIDSSDEHHPNANSPRIESRLPGSNAKLERALHHLKQDPERVSTDEGRQID
jgi:hypothetical protein